MIKELSLKKLKDISVKEDAVMKKIELLNEAFEKSLDVLNKTFQSKVDKVQSGDELLTRCYETSKSFCCSKETTSSR